VPSSPAALTSNVHAMPKKRRIERFCDLHTLEHFQKLRKTPHADKSHLALSLDIDRMDKK
jgi:hypothetical protein